MTGPFRDHEVVLLCPRCSDALVALVDGVCACAKCQGTWMPQASVERLFGDPRWPVGAHSWWHRKLACPDCTGEMAAISVEGGVVDRCPGHGAWFDKGELRRELGARTKSDIEALYAKLVPNEPAPDLRTWGTDELRKQRAELARDRHARILAERAAQERAIDAQAELVASQTASASKLVGERRQAKTQELADAREHYVRLNQSVKQMLVQVQAAEQELVALSERIAVLRKEIAELEVQS